MFLTVANACTFNTYIQTCPKFSFGEVMKKFSRILLFLQMVWSRERLQCSGHGFIRAELGRSFQFL